MRKILLLSYAILCVSMLKAAPGDTIKVKSHDKVHMNWYGNFDRKVKFPDASKTFNRILMHYTLGCPTGGCSEWDYTTQVQLRHRTGKMDSILKQTPNFKVVGVAKDSLRYSTTVTYKYTFNAVTKTTDSTANDTLKIDIYGDSLTPFTITQSIFGWAGDYYKPIFDTTGKKIDSVYVGYDAQLKRKNYNYYEVFEVIDNFELGRVITPYNGGVPITWQYTYTFDVTDYASLLKDSVEIRAHYSGYQDGFTITLDFEFIEGTPARECYKVIPLWNGASAYGANPSIENFLVARNVAIDAQMKQAVVRIIQTGHGFGGADNCAEFCQKEHYLKVGGQTRYQKVIWRDNCGKNPIYPQGGTWVYDRSNWCPGAEVWPYDYDVTSYITANSNATIDLDMESYTNQGNSNQSYIISGALFLYKENNFDTDASLEEVMAPNNTLRYARINPVCDYPLVKVKNNGGDTIKNIEFSFGPKGGTRNTYVWNGSLAPHQTAEIKMGTNINYTVSTPTTDFEMVIVKVNGKADEVTFNNQRNTKFANTPVYPNQIIVWLRTNNRGNESSYTIKDHYGNTVYSKSGLANATLYQDTLNLVNGCYTFEMLDAGGDGLGFWANPNAGTGQLFIRRASNGQVVKNFGTDWGSSIIQNFTTGYTLGVEETANNPAVTVFPNPNTGEFWLDINLPSADNATVNVFDYNGRMVYNRQLSAAEFVAHKVSLQGMADGVYMVQVQSNSGVFTQKLVKTGN
ncbi:peptide-N-glycosidase F-related protein [Oscillatoria amoena NRMC-F 0135]|nr:peptide-N-glycosidase F-related protein [Oscillatoria amoena NRMC-F 0135]